MIHIIANPSAGKNGTASNLEKFVEILKSKNVEYTVYESPVKGDAKRHAKNLSETGSEEKDIVVVGGDGTLHEVLNGIEDFSSCRLGLIPSGTGNDFAAAAGIPESVEKATELILEGDAKPTDYLNVGNVRCMNVAGLGMDVDVLVRYHKYKKHTKSAYLKSLIKSLIHFKDYEITVEVGEKKEEHKAFIATACNGRQIGGGIRICPVSVVDDGKIDVVVIEGMRFFKIIKAFMQLMKGKILQNKKAEHFLCERVRFLTKKPCTVQLDGELYDGLDFTATIAKGLRFFR